MKISNFFLIFLFLISSSFAVFNETKFEYVSLVNVNCDQYKGYVKFDLPSEYLSLNNPKSYMDVDYSIAKGVFGVDFIKIKDWYVKLIDGFETSNVEKIFDSNFNSYFVAENKSSLSIIFQNPSSTLVDKVVVDLKDSSISSLKVFDKNNLELNFSLVKNKFHYELIFDKPIDLNYLNLKFNFDKIIKIREISFYEKNNYSSGNNVYFYVDNNCSKTYKFYFGEFGTNNARFGSKTLPVIFQTQVNTINNNLYNNDFDGDGVLNNIDNCLDVSNPDQKDINYNKKGDACEDDDGDRIVNSIDNCINVRNFNQLDSDNDGIGDACDKQDDRFVEKNNYLVYILSGLIGIIFVFFSFKMMKKE